jgi:hypothetical protein
MRCYRVLFAVAVAASPTAPAQAQGYDLWADFDVTAPMPALGWQYGTKARVDDVFHPFTNLGSSLPGTPAFRFWGDSPAGDPPGVFQNFSAADAALGPAQFHPGEVGLQPGNSSAPGPGAMSVVRFRSPFAGPARISATFYGLVPIDPASAQAVITISRVPVLATFINGYRETDEVRFTTDLVLGTGDVIDFHVLDPSPISSRDMIALRARIAVIPEPSTAALAFGGVGLLCILTGPRGTRPATDR